MKTTSVVIWYGMTQNGMTQHELIQDGMTQHAMLTRFKRYQFMT